MEVFMRLTVSKHAEFSLYTRKDSPYFFVRFWNYETNKWELTRSTGVETNKPRKQAARVARELLKAGILTARFNRESEVLFLDYLTAFWKADSDHCREAATVKGKPLSKMYLTVAQSDIRLHITTYPGFKGLRLDQLKAGHLLAWQLWARETDHISGNRANACLKIMKVCLNDVTKRGIIASSPAAAVSKAMDGKPFGEKFFRDAFSRELEAIGISQTERKERNLSMHSLRHSFITLGRAAGISDLEIMALDGHKTLAQEKRYTHAWQVLDFNKARRDMEKIAEA
jgi:hypothetical protein